MEKSRQFKRHVIAAIGAIKDNLDNNQGTEESTIKMAMQFGVSRNVIQAAFKQHYGTGIRDYKLRQRMKLSRALLDQGKDVKQVSLEVHYATQSGFTSAFKKYFGITPTESINGNGHTFMLMGKLVQTRKK